MMSIVLILLLFMNRSLGRVNHTYDLAREMPGRFVCMFSMSWFGLGPSDPQGAGPDAYTSHWNIGSQGACVPASQPDHCGLDGERQISSNFRPLAGIYSSSGLDREGQTRIDLMLSILRKDPNCDHGHAQIDAWSVQLESIELSSRYLPNPSSNVEIPYQAYRRFRQRAELLQFPSGVIVPGYDSSWLYSFSSALGLGACDDSSPSDARDRCLNSTIADLVDILSDISLTSNYLINSKALLFIYTSVGGNLLRSNEWSLIWSSVRERVTQDFYAVCSTPSLLPVFDGVAPWIDLVAWSLTDARLSLYNRTLAWLDLVYGPLLSSVLPAGQLLFGGLTAGFDDFTQSWGSCQTRQIPRRADVIRAQLDYFARHSIGHLFVFTWDDWTEGSQFEPDTNNGPTLLLQLRQSLTSFYRQTTNLDGDQRLVTRWNTFPQLRNCTSIPVTSLPSIDLTCPTLLVSTAQQHRNSPSPVYFQRLNESKHNKRLALLLLCCYIVVVVEESATHEGN